jgi:hypothetical protein
MKLNNFLFEERRTTIHQDSSMDIESLRKYIKFSRGNLLQELEENGAKVICILQGLIGTPPNTFVQITRYPDLNTYRSAQANIYIEEKNLIENHIVKLFTAITPRPKDPFPFEDHRQIYSNRVFYVHKKNIELYGELSFKKVWPLYEAWGCNVLGLFSSITFESLHEIKLFAGYRSVAHWEETRNIAGVKPKTIDADVWEEGKNAVFQRAGLTFRTNVSLMRAVYLPKDK